MVEEFIMVKLGPYCLCLLYFVGKVPIPAAALGIIAGAGVGLIKGDLADIKEWFRFKKMEFMQKKHLSKSS